MGAVIKEKGSDDKMVFSLSANNINKAIRINLQPAQMHALLSNLNHIREDGITSQELIFSILTKFMIEILEVNIIIGQDNKNFESKIVLFDGDREQNFVCSVIDGIVLAKKFACPIFITEDLLNKYGVDEIKDESAADEGDYCDELKIQLKIAIENEDYEKASILSKEIFKNEQNKKITN